MLLALIIAPIHFALAQTNPAVITVGAFNIYANDGSTLTENVDYVWQAEQEEDEGGLLTLKSAKAITVQNQNSGSTRDRIVADNSSLSADQTLTITFNGLHINAFDANYKDRWNPFACCGSGKTCIILSSGSDNSLEITGNGTHTDAALYNAGGMLTIEGEGSLVANASRAEFGTPGIGNNNITIAGGTVTAQGSQGAPGIGGPNDCENIYITGGTVIARGGNDCGAGIGTDIFADSSETCSIVISGGNVTAYAGTNVQGNPENVGVAGIGGTTISRPDGAISITITGGVVTAQGSGVDSWYTPGPGIGGGDNSSVTITGGVVTATGGDSQSEATPPGYGMGGKVAINGDVVVMAKAGKNTDGFDPDYPPATAPGLPNDAVMTQGIVFDKSSDTPFSTSSWDSEMYGTSVTVAESVTFPTSLTVKEEQKLIIAEEVEVTLPEGAELVVDGEIENNGEVEISGDGKILVLVTYDARGGSVDPQAETKVYKDSEGTGTYNPLPIPTKADATFMGWYTEPTGGDEVTNETSVINENAHTLYAHWQSAATCLVTFVSNGGSEVPSQTVESGQTVAKPADPVKEGFVFTGWYNDAATTQLYDFSKAVTEDLVLYAGWSTPEPTPTPTPEPNPDYKDTWIPTTDGRWYYEDDNGNPVVNEWKEIEGKTYKFDSEGYALQSEWYFENDAWYYFAPDCAMEEGSWQWLNGAWYAFNWDGTMCTGWTWDNDYFAWYYVRSDGSLVYGTWEWIDGAWYGFRWDGTMCTGWTWDNRSHAWYYCYSSGVMARNTWVDGCYLNNSGRWIR